MAEGLQRAPQAGLSTALAFLGLGDFPTRYGAPDGPETWCAPLYLAQAHELETLHLFLTPEVRGQREARLRADLPKACALHIHDIPWGRDEAEAWAVFDAVASCVADQPGEILLDITHGFRHVPLLGAVAAHYIAQLEGRGVARVTYAALDMSRKYGYAPVLDLAPLLQLFDWSSAATLFARTGRTAALGAPLSRIDRELRQRTRGGTRLDGLKRLGNALQRFSGDLSALRAEDLRAGSAQRLLDAAGDPVVAEEVAAYAPPLSRALHTFAETAAPLTTAGHTDLVAWYVDHGHPALALGLGVEHLLSQTVRALGMPPEAQLIRERREQAKQRLFAYTRHSVGAENLRSSAPLMAALADAFFDFGFAEDHGDARVDLVGASQLALEGAAPQVAFHAEPRVA